MDKLNGIIITGPGDIEKKSMEIILQELQLRDKKIKMEHEEIVKRVIHTTADFDYADNLVFSDNAVKIGLEAVGKGCVIITDTKMAMSGINKEALKRLGGEVYCFIGDKDVADEAKNNQSTRAAAAIDKAVELYGNSDCPIIFAIGNAPTALIRLYELIKEKKISPALVIAVPVGFVNVVESKELIIQTDVPYIAAMGRKGGSNVAAAIMNAILYHFGRQDEQHSDSNIGDSIYNEKILKEYIEGILEPDMKLYDDSKAKWNRIAKPIRGMGILEDDISSIVAILGEVKSLKKCVAVMCADNGIVEEGVTQCDSSVTAVVAHNITVGKASVTNMAEVAGADVFAYDLGMKEDVNGVINKKCGYGTDNFLHGPAMSREKAAEAVIKGIEIAGELKAQGYHIIACGEMGIGNTTTSSAVTAVMLSVEAARVTGKGAGLEKDQIRHKAQIIQSAIDKNNPDRGDILDVLSKVGGYDIAAMCGLFLGGAVHGIPVIIDGFISGVAALLAKRMCKSSVKCMIASHMSGEPGAEMVMQEIGLDVPLRMNMALGEGTGAVALMPILDMSLKVFNNMPTFHQINIDEYEEYSE